jgi:hypothetical protein
LYYPAGKTNDIATFIKNAIKRIGDFSNPQKRREKINQLKTQLEFDNLSRTALQIEPKILCTTSFITPSQLFFTNRKICIQEYKGKAYSLIEKQKKNTYYMFDKSFANNTLTRSDNASYKAFLDMVKESFRDGRAQVLDFLRARAENIVKPSKLSSEHYLAKRLGDAGQAIASRQIFNSILVTHDRVLLAFALNIGVPRIVFTHKRQNTAAAAAGAAFDDDDDDVGSGFHPISIFERNDMQNESELKKNILRDILSALQVVSRATNEYNIERVYQLINEYNDYRERINTINQEKIEKINSLIDSLNEDFERLSGNYDDYNSLQLNINKKYQEFINEINQILPFLKINVEINITKDFTDYLNDFVTEFSEDILNLDTFPIESLNTLYNIAVSLNSFIENKEKMKEQIESSFKSLNEDEFRKIQLVRRRISGRVRRSVFTGKTNVTSQIESKLQLDILKDYLQLISDRDKDKIIEFLRVCIASNFIEGGNYAHGKIERLISIHSQSGGKMEEEQDEEALQTELETQLKPNKIKIKNNEELVSRLYMIEEFIVSFIYSIFSISII